MRKFILVGMLFTSAGVADADAPVDHHGALELDRDAPPPGRVEFGFDGGAPVAQWAAGVQIGYLDHPLVLRTPRATRELYPVRHRETLVLGGAYSPLPSVVVDARLPLAHQVGSRYQGLGDEERLDRWVAGDLALGARLHVTSRDRYAAFVRAQLTVPTGNDFQFAGDARWSLSTALIARAKLPRDIVAAATMGVRVRGAEIIVADRVAGNELFGGLGVAAPIPPIAKLWCVPEQVKGVGELVFVVGDKATGNRGPSPVEARIGIVAQPRPELQVGVRIGGGFNDQIGSPRFRAMIELAWHGPFLVAAPSRERTLDEVDDTL